MKFDYNGWLAAADRIGTTYAQVTGNPPAPTDIAHFLWRVGFESDRYPSLEHAMADLTGWVPPAPVPSGISRLAADGRAFLRADGAPFVWRGATSFRLVELVAHGREDDAVAWLNWMRASGFNVARVLTMCRGMFDLSPADGRAALRRTLDLAAARGIYLHVTVLADTQAVWGGATTGEAKAHVREVAGICDGVENVALLEIANEPYHATQASAVHDVGFLWELDLTCTSRLNVALGPAADDEASTHSLGDVTTAHLDRGRDPWNMVRRVRELENVSATTGKPVVNSEPIGFDEVERPVARLTNPAIAAAFGVLSRIFNIPTTFHSTAGLHCAIPGPVQEACADAFVAGTCLVPDNVGLTFKNAGWADSPVKSARWAEGEPKPNACVRAYSGVNGDSGILALLGVQGDPGIEMQQGWTLGPLVAEWPELRVHQISR